MRVEASELAVTRRMPGLPRMMWCSLPHRGANACTRATRVCGEFPAWHSSWSIRTSLLLLRLAGRVQLLAGLAIRECAEVRNPLLARQIAVEFGAGIHDQVGGTNRGLGDQQISCAANRPQETPSGHKAYVAHR